MTDRLTDRLTLRYDEREHTTLIASLTLAAIQYADPSVQIAILERLGCKNAGHLIDEARHTARRSRDRTLPPLLAKGDQAMTPESTPSARLSATARAFYHDLEVAMLAAGFDPDERDTDGEGDDEFWNALDRAVDHIDHILAHIDHR